MKRRIFIQSFLITLLSVLIIFSAGIGITYINNKKIISERLITETQLAAALLDDATDLSSLDIFQNQKECRVTVIALDGEVLYDSDAGDQLENHLDREEVAAALNGNGKTVERYSETFDCQMTYYAMKTPLKNGQEVILRIAIWSAEINDYIFSVLPFLCLTLILCALIAGLFAKKLSENISKRITDISKSLKSVNDGDYIPLHTDMGDTEFYSIYSEINELNSKTLSHIQREENEREKLNAVLDNISQGIIALSKDESIVLANGSALRLFDGDASAVSHPLSYLVSDRNLLALLSEVPDPHGLRYEVAYRDKYLLIEIIPPVGELLKNEVADIIILSDITSEKELSRRKEEFFANASHELKTPLTAMLGLSELALAKSTNDSVKKNLERIHKETGRLSELISDMLKLSRLETLGEEEVTAAVQVREVALEVISELGEGIERKGITATVHGDVTVMADEKKIYELLQNLCSNAVNYNRDGGQLDVFLEDREDTSVIRVKDTGIGISEENQPHLFERFYRVDKSRSKKTGGTGLGLAIVKHICALYHAEIRLQSTVGVGTEITITFQK